MSSDLWPQPTSTTLPGTPSASINRAASVSSTQSFLRCFHASSYARFHSSSLIVRNFFLQSVSNQSPYFLRRVLRAKKRWFMELRNLRREDGSNSFRRLYNPALTVAL